MIVIPGPDARTRRETSQERRHLVAQAIAQATATQWLGAIETNQRLIDASGQDVEAYNRLGKAYAQLGRIPAARAASSSVKVPFTLQSWLGAGSLTERGTEGRAP